MEETVADIAEVVCKAIPEIVSRPKKKERPSTKEIYKALKTARQVLAKRYAGGDWQRVKCRYAGSTLPKERCGHRRLRVLGYLWDFSFSLHSIPQAIEQGSCALPRRGRYQLLFVVESELGTPDEICRDLLKLLEARTAIRCLVYRRPKKADKRTELRNRMIRVLRNHAHFDPRREVWLFIGLEWGPGHIACDADTLHDDGKGFKRLHCL